MSHSRARDCWSNSSVTQHMVEDGKDLSLKAGQNFSLLTQRAAQLTVGDDLAIQTGKSLVTPIGRHVQVRCGTDWDHPGGRRLMTIRA